MAFQFAYELRKTGDTKTLDCGTGRESQFLASVTTGLQNRGIEDIFIAAIAGLADFSDAIQAIWSCSSGRPEADIFGCDGHYPKKDRPDPELGAYP